MSDQGIDRVQKDLEDGLTKDKTEKNVIDQALFPSDDHGGIDLPFCIYETNFGSLSIVEKFPAADLC